MRERLLGGKGTCRIGQLPDHIPARQMTHELRSRHIGHQAPFGLSHRKQRTRRDVAQIGAKGELEAATMPCVRLARSAKGRRLLPRAMAPILSTSRPAQKARPSPDSTTARKL